MKDIRVFDGRNPVMSWATVVQVQYVLRMRACTNRLPIDGLHRDRLVSGLARDE